MGFDAFFPEAMALLAILIVAGAIAGLISGLLGVGGGIVIVPVLFFLFQEMDIPESVRMHVAVGTSLATIIFTGFISARGHWRKNSVDTDLLWSWGPWIALGVVVGTVIGGNVSGWVLSAIFAVIAGGVAINMSFGRSEASARRPMAGTPMKQVLGSAIGLISVMMGIGGGTLSVPILSFFDYPIRKAVGTASAIGLIIAIPGTIGYAAYGFGRSDLPAFSLGYVNIAGLLVITAISMFTAPLGVKLAHAVPPKVLRICFAVFLAMTSIRMITALF